MAGAPAPQRIIIANQLHLCLNCGQLGLHYTNKCEDESLQNDGFLEAVCSDEFKYVAEIIKKQNTGDEGPYHCPVCYSGNVQHDWGHCFRTAIFDKYDGDIYTITPNRIGVVGSRCSICTEFHSRKRIRECEIEQRKLKELGKPHKLRHPSTIPDKLPPCIKCGDILPMHIAQECNQTPSKNLGYLYCMQNELIKSHTSSKRLDHWRRVVCGTPQL